LAGGRLMDEIRSEADGCDLGDQRLNKRYQLLLERLGGQPQLSIPAACRGEAEVDAAYRFFDHAKVKPAKLLAPHQAATVQRMAAQATVLVVQDTTEIDLTRPERVVGGPLADQRHFGFFSHLLLAMTPAGVPLGLLGDRTWARNPDTFGQSKRCHKRQPLADKESVRWIEGYQRCAEVARRLPGVEVIAVCDSEGDIYELFVAAHQQEHAAKFIVRACQSRRLEDDPASLLREFVASTPIVGTRAIAVSKRDAPAAEPRRRRQARSERNAILNIHVATVTPRSPQRCDGPLPNVPVNVVLAREANPPAGEAPIEWLLVTDLPAATLADAERILDLYTQRWWIEVYFRILKSGCGVEKLQLETDPRMLNALMIYKIVAWRVLLVTMLGRSCPDLPCDCVLEDAEWKSVYMTVLHKKPPHKPPPLAEFTLLLARLGGYLARKHDPPPGPKAMWIGLQHARILAIAWKTFGPEANTYGE
jgi:hypothetical protein